jgi:hypothetical protein
MPNEPTQPDDPTDPGHKKPERPQPCIEKKAEDAGDVTPAIIDNTNRPRPDDLI